MVFFDVSHCNAANHRRSVSSVVSSSGWLLRALLIGSPSTNKIYQAHRNNYEQLKDLAIQMTFPLLRLSSI
jgi:hypothetical protein